ncbi:TPR-like protein [Pseudovirgaria hyperparasitica]|uniref:TPR-like protein n=1 Tax=Pseudovirgaria hyperparasitica TaxID=470096 RepID=A0A6A6VY75_9PEZI|nr:TPR-like protein [Pseudovirgaria hyperparasitica]KAF2754654.1 TPR-like protein [Pseudovirgaria hyperparasitica]
MAAILSEPAAAQLRAQLQNAVIQCSDRCLSQSAKWAAEILNSFQETTLVDGSETEPDSSMSDASPSDEDVFILHDPIEVALEKKELPRYLLAKAYFDCREFDRCAAIFLPANVAKGPIRTSSPIHPQSIGKGKRKATMPTEKRSIAVSLVGISQKALFLSLYAKYMSGEKRKDEESEMILGPADGGVTVNKELNDVSKILEDWFSYRNTAGGMDSNGGGWLEYLYGIVLAKNKNERLAKKWLLESVRVYPYNWGAWVELSSLLATSDELSAVIEQVPPNIMAFIFHIYSSQELYQSTDRVHANLNEIESIFPTSSFLKTQRALLYYHSKDFEEAESIFSDLLQTDPYRIDSLDNYSNILYVLDLKPKLAFLAQLATATDKFRPETCCVVGNYFSLKSEHEKAVMYFRRALMLDRNFLSAWTLMGHEYVEMKNTHAAIESYRRAVDVNRKDYRAWYGLGQTYEVLEMHSYALFYYQRAASLRPYDPKMWMAVGQSFGRVGKCANGIRSYKRALVAGSYYDTGAGSGFGNQDGLGAGILDPEVLYQIALLYERSQDNEECAAYMELTLAQEEGPEDQDTSDTTVESIGVGVTPTTSKARMWLAKWEYSQGGFQRSMELANELCQDGVEVEDAKALVRDIRARVEKGYGGQGMKKQVDAVEKRYVRST